MTVLRCTAIRLSLVIGWSISFFVLLPEARAQDFDLKLPDKLSLGTEQEAEISVRAAGNENVRFFSNVGRVANVRQAGDRLIATYYAPKQRYPQVAIIVAATPDLSRVAWGSIPLHGQPTVKIRYGRRANVLVRAGDKEFGPVQTDRRGRAELLVEVAPGVQSVTVFGADRQGTTKERENPLEVPQFERVFLLCPSEKRVLGFSVDEHGKPLREQTLPLDAEVGTRTEYTRLESGATVAAFEVSEESLASFAVRSQAPGSEQPARCTPPARASGFEVALPEAFVAGQGPVSVSIRPKYQDDTVPEKGEMPSASVEFGTLSRLKRQGDEYVATWTLPNDFEGRAEAVLSVARSDGGAAEEHQLPLRAAEVTQLRASASDDALPANGSAQVTVMASLLDRFGNVARVPAKLEAEGKGSLSTFRQGDDGTWAATYVAPTSAGGGVDVVTVRETERRLSAEVRIELSADRDSFLLSVRAGYLTDFAKVAGPIALIGLRYRLPMLSEMPMLGLDVGGYLSSSSNIDSEGLENVQADVLGVPVLLRAGLGLPLGGLDLFVHMAGGILWSSADVRSSSSGQLIEDDVTFVLGGFVGSEISLGPGALVIEAGYLLAPRGGTIEGQGAGFVADLGYGLAF